MKEMKPKIVRKDFRFVHWEPNLRIVSVEITIKDIPFTFDPENYLEKVLDAGQKAIRKGGEKG